MTPALPDDWRALSAADRESLATFTCRHFKEPWTEIVQIMVREHLADSLERHTAEAVGAWNATNLIGVASWSFKDDSCECHIVAVALGHQGRGLGRRLKEYVVEVARAAGAGAVVSEVHWDNQPMLELNSHLGASVVAKPGDREYCLCVIPLS